MEWETFAVYTSHKTLVQKKCESQGKKNSIRTYSFNVKF